MNVTVILCTYNRAATLRKALESVAKSVVPESIDWEVLVVDNNSRDRTRETIEEFCALYPRRFRYLFEAAQGKSHALNSGIRATVAEILAFMDDDVEIDCYWLHTLTSVFSRGPWTGAGGRIRAEEGFVPPPWMETHGRYALAPLAFFDLGPDAGETKEAPFGTNMAFKRDVFKKYGGFRTDLGPQPGSEIRNEDTEFGERLLAAGERFWYEPSALVYHSVPRERIRKSYFLRWWFDKARAEVRQEGIPQRSRLYVAGVPLFLFRSLGAWTFRWMLSFNPGKRFSAKLNVWKIAGTMQECRRMSKITKPIAPGAQAVSTIQGSSREG
ncbi:MAG: glycosyltransferase [Terracidiphilus sp.]